MLARATLGIHDLEVAPSGFPNRYPRRAYWGEEHEQHEGDDGEGDEKPLDLHGRSPGKTGVRDHYPSLVVEEENGL
jgi:hypothetical protein